MAISGQDDWPAPERTFNKSELSSERPGRSTRASDRQVLEQSLPDADMTGPGESDDGIPACLLSNTPNALLWREHTVALHGLGSASVLHSVRPLRQWRTRFHKVDLT